jgi:hypothetical protein
MFCLSVALASRNRKSATFSASFDCPAKNLSMRASVRRYSGLVHPSHPCMSCSRHLVMVWSPARFNVKKT